MADISKIKLANGTTVDLKDAQGRTNMTTLLGEHALEALGAAAWLGVDATLTDEGTGVATSGTIKSYVDAQVQTINKFDVKVYDSLPTASADTMYILGLVAEEGTVAGTYAEYITVRSGAEGSYTYAWEKIGTTAADLTDYVKKTTTVAGVDLQDNITVAEMQEALGLGDMAYADTASGETTLETIDAIEMDKVTVAGNAAVTLSDADAELTKADYTPAGTITGDAISGGSIEVTLKDADAATQASITYNDTDYTPAGNVTGTVSVPNAAAIAKADDGVQISGSVSKPTITVTPVAATVLGSVKTAGTLPTKDADTFDGGSFEKGDAIAATTEGIVASVGTGDDAETLIFTAAATGDVMAHSATFTAATFEEGEFHQGAMPEFEEADVVGSATAALDAAPEFTGDKFAVNLTNADADITAEFEATNSTKVISNVSYLKQVVDTHEFTPVAATLGFSGTEVKDMLVTGVSYKKADAEAAFSVEVTPAVKTLTKTAKTISITANPDA